MPMPSPGDVHVNRPLTNIAIAFKQDAAQFVASKFFPEVPVTNQSNSYYIWDRADLLRDEATEVGPTAEAPIGAARLSTDSYNCKVYKWAKLISEQELANQDEALNLEESASEQVMTKLLIRREKQFLGSVFVNSTWTGSTTGNDLVGGTDFVKFDDFIGSDPVSVIRAQVFNLMKFGLNPRYMKLLVGPVVFQYLLDHPKFLERYENIQASVLNQELMAAVLGIGEVMVPMAVEVTSAEGAATTTNAFIFGKSMLLAYVAPAPGINVVSAGYMFTWADLVMSANEGINIKRWWRDEKSSWQVEGQIAQDPKRVSTVCGAYFRSVVS